MRQKIDVIAQMQQFYWRIFFRASRNPVAKGKVYKTNVATQNSVTKCYHESHLRLDKDLEMWTGSSLSLICKSNIIVALYKIKGTILRRKKAMNGNNFLLRVM